MITPRIDKLIRVTVWNVLDQHRTTSHHLCLFEKTSYGTQPVYSGLLI